MDADASPLESSHRKHCHNGVLYDGILDACGIFQAMLWAPCGSCIRMVGERHLTTSSPSVGILDIDTTANRDGLKRKVAPGQQLR
jgi:hypothetical protein